MPKKNLATFTPEEEHAWEFAFGYYLEEGMKDDDACNKAWEDVCKEFPRLSAFDGAKA